jgi:predicted GIY-YIG superfamily endonuclease
MLVYQEETADRRAAMRRVAAIKGYTRAQKARLIGET